MAEQPAGSSPTVIVRVCGCANVSVDVEGNCTRKGKHAQDKEKNIEGRENPKKTPEIKSAQADASRGAKLPQQQVRDQKSADHEENIHALLTQQGDFNNRKSTEMAKKGGGGVREDYKADGDCP